MKANESILDRLSELQEQAAKEKQITVRSICAELDAAIEVAKSKGQANAMVSAAGLRAKLAGLLIDKSQVVSNPNDFVECQNVEDIADRMLGGLTNARWLPITDQDRAELADLLRRTFAEIQGFLDSVNAQPLNTVRPPAAYLTNRKTQTE